MHANLNSSGFSAIEALSMLATLFVFSMIVAALWLRYQKDPASMPPLSALTASPVGESKPAPVSPLPAPPAATNATPASEK